MNPPNQSKLIKAFDMKNIKAKSRKAHFQTNPEISEDLILENWALMARWYLISPLFSKDFLAHHQPRKHLKISWPITIDSSF